MKSKRPRLGTRQNPVYTASSEKEQWPRVLTAPVKSKFNVNAPSINSNWINDRLGNTEPFYPDYHNTALAHLDQVLKRNGQATFLLDAYKAVRRNGGIT